MSRRPRESLLRAGCIFSSVVVFTTGFVFSIYALRGFGEDMLHPKYMEPEQYFPCLVQSAQLVLPGVNGEPGCHLTVQPWVQGSESFKHVSTALVCECSQLVQTNQTCIMSTSGSIVWYDEHYWYWLKFDRARFYGFCYAFVGSIACCAICCILWGIVDHIDGREQIRQNAGNKFIPLSIPSV